MESWKDHETLLHLVDGVVYVGEELAGFKTRLETGTEWMQKHEEVHKNLINHEPNAAGGGPLKSVAAIMVSAAVLALAFLSIARGL